jgi:hypothetical protein
MLVSVMGSYDNGVIKLDELPLGVVHAKAIITLIPSTDEDSISDIMSTSIASFNEWDNEADKVYDTL